jgi:hypothetical protein
VYAISDRRPRSAISANNNNTIAIKTAMTDNGALRKNNANPKIRNNGYVTMLLSLFNCKNNKSEHHPPIQRAYPLPDIQIAVSEQFGFW